MTNVILMSAKNDPMIVGTLVAMCRANLLAAEFLSFAVKGDNLKELKAFQKLLKGEIMVELVSTSMSAERVNELYYTLCRAMVEMAPIPTMILEAIEGVLPETTNSENDYDFTGSFKKQGLGSIKDFQVLYKDILLLFKLRLYKLNIVKNALEKHGIGDSDVTKTMNEDLTELCFSPNPNKDKLRQGIILFSNCIQETFNVFEKIMKDEEMLGALKIFKSNLK